MVATSEVTNAQNVSLKASQAKNAQIMTIESDVLRLPSGYHHLTVVSGVAWATFGHDDVIIQAGQSVDLRSTARCPALISAQGTQRLVLKIG